MDWIRVEGGGWRNKCLDMCCRLSSDDALLRCYSTEVLEYAAGCCTRMSIRALEARHELSLSSWEDKPSSEGETFYFVGVSLGYLVS